MSLVGVQKSRVLQGAFFEKGCDKRHGLCALFHHLPTTLMLIRAVSSPASFFNVILKGPESSLSAVSMTRQLLSGYVSARILPLSVIH